MQICLVSEISRRMTTCLTAAKVSAEGASQSERCCSLKAKLSWPHPCRSLKGLKDSCRLREPPARASDFPPSAHTSEGQVRNSHRTRTVSCKYICVRMVSILVLTGGNAAIELSISQVGIP